MTSNWQSYIPDYLVQQIKDHPEANLLGQSQRFDAVVLFADVRETVRTIAKLEVSFWSYATSSFAMEFRNVSVN